MAKFTLDFGQTVDILTQDELNQSLEDARLRALVAGVKAVNIFIGPASIGASANYTLSPTQAPAAGFVWAIMNIGFELSASFGVRIYKQVPPGTTPVGAGRLVQQSSAQVCPSAQFSKGQLMMTAGDVLTFQALGGNILSINIAAIEVPAERIGELLL